jgi:hypothetical protein
MRTLEGTLSFNLLTLGINENACATVEERPFMATSLMGVTEEQQSHGGVPEGHDRGRAAIFSAQSPKGVTVEERPFMAASPTRKTMVGAPKAPLSTMRPGSNPSPTSFECPETLKH